MVNWFTSITLAAAVFGASSASGAEEEQSFLVKVNVSIPVHEMYLDIEQQVRGACRQSLKRSVVLNYNAPQSAKCRDKMVSDVIKLLGLPKPTAVHERATHRDTKTP